eukprot:TRINITY_DN8586_c0_g1_i1.p1 TRINITY_DN8586_c0_g1~~TRINITY_DN8586_c0_g1_i1.p1  ORF type:complete len:273 (+),score=75.72 TRINITY_DN8586_c0_g1_i1:2-820(+)
MQRSFHRIATRTFFSLSLKGTQTRALQQTQALAQSPVLSFSRWFLSRTPAIASNNLPGRKKDNKKGGGKGGKGRKDDSDDDEDSKKAVPEFDFKNAEKKVEDLIKGLSTSFDALQIGKANPALLKSVKVETDDGTFPISTFAQVTVKDPVTLMVLAFDKKMAKSISTAIENTDIKLAGPPKIDDAMIRVSLPRPTKEYRDEIIKTATKNSENAKIGLRKLRKDCMDDIKKQEKIIPKDEVKRLEQKLQKKVDDATTKINSLLQAKEKEIANA